ncbi:MAG TPA: alkaline phosphatase family protein, partial [Chloroflexota bacterium]|nr:alkaline phosphatase family protein [Chloroflexota bacterium]
TVQSLRENDRRLASLMETLDRLGLLDHTDVLLTSDHGFSTAGPRRWDGKGLASLGLEELEDGDETDVATTGQGGAITLGERSVRHATAIVRHLQALDWVGAVFTRDDGPAAGLPGTLPLSALWNGRVGRRAPDIRFSIAWSDEANAHGVRGTVLAGSWNPNAHMDPSSPRAGRRGASHGSASPFDMRNSLFAWGPSFRRDLRSAVPAGTVDVAPTIRHLLALPQVEADGRVLLEALAGSSDTPAVSAETLDAALPNGSYRQALTLARVGHTSYVVQAQAWRS